MRESLQKVFADKLNSGERVPFLTFQVPWLGKFGILGCPVAFWVQLFTVLLGQSILCITLGAIAYYFIVQKRGTSAAFLVGYGFIIPFVIVMPFYLVPFLGLQNMVIMTVVTSTPIFVTFRCLQAMHGTSPPVVEKDIFTYCSFYSSVAPFRYDTKTQAPVKTTTTEVLEMFFEYLAITALASLTYSVLIPTEYSPFPSPRRISQPVSSLMDLVHWGHLLNNYIVAHLTSVCLHSGSLGLSLGVTAATGNKTEEFMKNPMLESSSPSDFWSRRWNLVVQDLFKRGVYIPLRKSNFSRTTASVATFVVSGVLHEYVLAVIALKGQTVADEAPYQPRYGYHFAFFLWNGLVMCAEYALQGNPLIAKLNQKLPQPIITMLVLLTVIPVSHWFTDEFIASGFYADSSMSMPILLRIKE